MVSVKSLFSRFVMAAASALALSTLLTVPLAHADDVTHNSASPDFLVAGSLSANASDFVEFALPFGQQGMRFAVRSVGGESTGTLRLRRDNIDGDVIAESTGGAIQTLFVLPNQLLANRTYFLEIQAGNEAYDYDLRGDSQLIRLLSWDDGSGANTVSSPYPGEVLVGDIVYRIDTQSSLYGAMRVALDVADGSPDYDVLMQRGSLDPNNETFESNRIGDDGFILPAAEFGDAQDWYLLVSQREHSDLIPSWELVAGDLAVTDLGQLSDVAVTEEVIVGPEGVAYFETTVSSDALAWQLRLSNLNGASSDHELLVSESSAPVDNQYGQYVDWQAMNQLMLVPPYLSTATYVVGVNAEPGTALALHSVEQPVTDLAFESSEAVSVDAGDFAYRTYRVSVPVDPFGWTISIDPDNDETLAVYARSGDVPNEFYNTSLAEAPSGGITAAMTLAPPVLTDGTWYITVKGSGAFSATLSNGDPEVTNIDFTNIDAIVNGVSPDSGIDYSTRTGWRFFALGAETSADQLAALGWQLQLAQQTPGTLIAIRRNALPSISQYRDGTDFVQETQFVDAATALEILQRPAQPDDIYYIGIYNPTQALGGFAITTGETPVKEIAFNDAVEVVNSQNPDLWNFYKVEVPGDARGWEIRLREGNGAPAKFVLRRGQLPVSTDREGCDSVSLRSTSGFAQGCQQPSQRNWAGSLFDDGTDVGEQLILGMNQTLEAGTYFIGVTRKDVNDDRDLSYALELRGIGDNCGGLNVDCASQVTNLSYNSSVSGSVDSRDISWYRVTVPTNTPHWGMSLEVEDNAEAGLAVRRSYIPSLLDNSDSDDDSFSPNVGRYKPQQGSEYFYKFPESGSDAVRSGVYYVAVIGRGASEQSNDYTVTEGISNYTLTTGPLAIDDQTDTPLSADQPLAIANQSVNYGELKAYKFRVPEGALALQAEFTASTDYPQLLLTQAEQLPNNGRNIEGGVLPLDNSYEGVSAAAPVGDYYVVVEGNSAIISNAGQVPSAYDLEVSIQGETLLDFNQGAIAVTNQGNDAYQYFRVDVPQDAEGWELRVKDIVTNDDFGDVFFEVRRGSIPGAPGSTSCGAPSINSQSGFPEGCVVTGMSDWAGAEFNDGGDVGRQLVLGMGKALEAGTYFVRVSNFGSSPVSYTMESRGIGAQCGGNLCTIPVNDLPFVGSVMADLPAREVGWYRVNVPEGTTQWEVSLKPEGLGEADLAVREGGIASVLREGTGTQYSSDDSFNTNQAKLVENIGNDYFYSFADPVEAQVTPGVYYIAVISRGNSPQYSYSLGSGDVSFTLSSGAVQVEDFTGVGLGSGVPFGVADQSVDFGQIKAYKFRAPEGASALTATFSQSSNDPYLYITSAVADYDQFPNFRLNTEGGKLPIDQGRDGVSVASPSGDYLVVVRGYSTAGGNSNFQQPSTYDLQVAAQTEEALDFNSDSITVMDQEPDAYRYYRIDVPEDARGWELRLHDLTDPNAFSEPNFVLRRGRLPGDGGDTSCSSFSIGSQTQFWEGCERGGINDWTGAVRTSDGGRVGQQLILGMDIALEPGTYYVAVSANSIDPVSYTLQTRGIGNLCGGEKCAIPVVDLDFNGSDGGSVIARDIGWYRVSVPENTPNWALNLDVEGGGEADLVIRQGGIPSLRAERANSDSFGNEGRHVRQEGDEYFYKFPAGNGSQSITAGDYYIGVVSRGNNPAGELDLGSGSSLFTLTSGPVSILDQRAAVISSDSPLRIDGQTLDYREVGFYQFSTPDDALGVEVQLLNRIGQPEAALVQVDELVPEQMPNPSTYAVEGGYNADSTGGEVVTSLGAGDYALAVIAGGFNDEPTASFDIEINVVEAQVLTFDGGEVSGDLANDQNAFYRVEVPELIDGAPVLGWKLTKDVTSGSLSINYRQGALPNDFEAEGGRTLSSSARQTVVAPPVLTPGVWYIEVIANGATTYTLGSQPVRTIDDWIMPAGYNNEFGDSGSLSLDEDGGLAIAEGTTDYFQIKVPEGNGGLMRVELEAISGDPDFYVRRGAISTTDHDANGSSFGDIVDIYHRESGTAYGNIVPEDGVVNSELEAGDWYIGVKAKNANARYRLRVSTGNVQPLALDGGSVQGQLLNAYDFQYFEVQIPQATTNPETSVRDVWYVDVTEASGDIVVFVRDTVPPGNRNYMSNRTYPYYYSRTNIADWRTDAANYSDQRKTLVDTPRDKIVLPPMEPGKTYYLGAYANSDANFDLSISTSESPFVIDGEIDFAEGVLDNEVVPAGESRFYRVYIPEGASRWIHNASHSSDVEMRLQIGSVPDDGFYDWRSFSANSSYNQSLVEDDGTPNRGFDKHWREQENIFLEVVNNGANEEIFSLAMNGQFLATEDLDDDGILDAYERAYFFGSINYSPSNDYDGDSLTLLEEFLLGLDPTSTDTDGDSIGDGIEVAFGLDPTDPADGTVDTDGDLIPDYLEAWMGTDAETAEPMTFAERAMAGTVVLTQKGQFGPSGGDTLLTLGDDESALWHRQWDRPTYVRAPDEAEFDFYPENTNWSMGMGGYLELDMGMRRIQSDSIYNAELDSYIRQEVELDRLIYIDVTQDPEKPRWRELAVTLVSYPFEDIPSEWRFEVAEYDVVPESDFIPFDVATLTSSEWASFGCYDQYDTALYSFSDDGFVSEVRSRDGYTTDKAWEIADDGSLIISQNFYDDCRVIALEAEGSTYKVIIASDDSYGLLESTLFTAKTDFFETANQAVNRYLLAPELGEGSVSQDALAILPDGVGYRAFSEAGLSLEDDWREADEIMEFTWHFEEGVVYIESNFDQTSSSFVESCEGLDECQQIFGLVLELDTAVQGAQVMRTRRQEFDDFNMWLSGDLHEMTIFEVSTDTTDSDGDGLLDFMDDDDDNDTVPDDQDAFPLDPEESADTDGDEIGNNADTDDDNDNVIDTEDAFPLDASESVDTDGDEIGNNADTDDDNDGLLDTEEAEIGTNPLLADTDEDGFSDGDEVAAGSNPTDANSVPGNDEEDMDTGLPVWLVPLIEISRERLSAP